MTNFKSLFRPSTKVFSGTVLALILILTVLVFVPQAKAAESPNILVGSDLTVGSTGSGVAVLQGLMSELGFLNVPMGIPFGYYGGMTRDAVARYQSSLNVSPPVGYFGPLTKTAMHSDFSQHGYLKLLGW